MAATSLTSSDWSAQSRVESLLQTVTTLTPLHVGNLRQEFRRPDNLHLDQASFVRWADTVTQIPQRELMRSVVLCRIVFCIQTTRESQSTFLSASSRYQHEAADALNNQPREPSIIRKKTPGRRHSTAFFCLQLHHTPPHDHLQQALLRQTPPSTPPHLTALAVVHHLHMTTVCYYINSQHSIQLQRWVAFTRSFPKGVFTSKSGQA